MVEVHDRGLSTKCQLPKIKNLTTNRVPQADTRVEFVVICRDTHNLTTTKAETLWTAIDTGVRAYEHHSLILDLDLNSTFRWMFMVADIPYLIFAWTSTSLSTC